MEGTERNQSTPAQGVPAEDVIDELLAQITELNKRNAILTVQVKQLQQAQTRQEADVIRTGREVRGRAESG